MAITEEREKIVAVVPAYNEAETIAAVVVELRDAGVDVVVVDDGSADDTARLARSAGGIVLRHVINRGQGASLQTGIEYALQRGASVIVTFDADGQHRVADISKLVEALRMDNVDVAIGSRFLSAESNVPWRRRMILRAAILFTHLVSGIALTDAHNGLRAFRRDAAAQIRLTLDGMAHASELVDQIHSRGLRVVEVPVVIRYTAYSLKKGQSGVAAIRIAFDYLVMRVFR